jgi:1,4-dihydroxy-2-naphthoate octaprenyltransferase
VNYANDYSDGIRGTDDVRVGPTRLVASGLARPGQVKNAALLSFALAALLGLILALVTSLWILVIGVAALLAGWFYTGGSHPYGYFGLGEIFVFVFFGLVATTGTSYVVLERVPVISWVLGSAVGALACALLVINNLRDIPSDTAVGKKTLAVRLGDRRTRVLYQCLVIGGVILVLLGTLWEPGCLFVLLAAPLMVKPIRTVRQGASGPALIAVLGNTGQLQLIVGALLTGGLVFI